MFPNYEARIKELQTKMSMEGFNAAVLTGQGALIYFGGTFCPWRSAIVLGAKGNPILVTCLYDMERIKHLTWLKDFVGWEFSHPSDFCHKVIDCLKNYVSDGKGYVGAELDVAHSPGVLSAQEMIDLKEGLRNIEFKNILPHIHEIMLVKDDYEIEQLRRAAEAADVGMQAGFGALSPGICEFAVLGVVEHAMREVDSMFTWSVTGNEIGSGYRQRYEKGFTVMPSDKLIQYGDLVTIDIHPMISGYLGDLALNAVVGPPSESVRQLADSWEEIVQILIASLKAGNTVHEVAVTVEEAIKRRKLEEYCTPVFGHGLGTDARIPPVIVRDNELMLEPQMVVEALLQITDPAVGGLRLEVPVLITEQGNEVLCKTPLKLHISR